MLAQANCAVSAPQGERNLWIHRLPGSKQHAQGSFSSLGNGRISYDNISKPLHHKWKRRFLSDIWKSNGKAVLRSARQNDYRINQTDRTRVIVNSTSWM